MCPELEKKQNSKKSPRTLNVTKGSANLWLGNTVLEHEIKKWNSSKKVSKENALETSM